MRWVKGQSGNPKGRKRNPLALVDIRTLLNPHCEAIAAKLISLLSAEDEKVQLEAAKLCASYLWGKPSETVNVATPGDLEFRIITGGKT